MWKRVRRDLYGFVEDAREQEKDREIKKDQDIDRGPTKEDVSLKTGASASGKYGNSASDRPAL